MGRCQSVDPARNEIRFSAVTSRQLQSQRAARWLRTAGIEVADDAVIELSPLTAIAAEDLQQAEGLPQRIDPGQRTVL